MHLGRKQRPEVGVQKSQRPANLIDRKQIQAARKQSNCILQVRRFRFAALIGYTGCMRWVAVSCASKLCRNRHNLDYMGPFQICLNGRNLDYMGGFRAGPKKFKRCAALSVLRRPGRVRGPFSRRVITRPMLAKMLKTQQTTKQAHKRFEKQATEIGLRKSIRPPRICRARFRHSAPRHPTLAHPFAKMTSPPRQDAHIFSHFFFVEKQIFFKKCSKLPKGAESLPRRRFARAARGSAQTFNFLHHQNITAL